MTMKTPEQWQDDTPESLEARCWALRERAERAESERDKALACVAEMRVALERWDNPYMIDNESLEEKLEKDIVARNHALSTDCGKGWLSPEKAKELEQSNKRGWQTVHDLEAQVNLLVEALEKIDSIATDTAKFCALPTEMQQMQDVAKRMIAAVKQP